VNDSPAITISLIGDLSFATPQDAVLVEGNVGYVQACLRLSQAVRARTGLTLWVRSDHHYRWLQDFATQIDCPAVCEEKTARLVLADQWNVDPPAWLTDADVLEQGLLDLEVDAGSQARFEDRCLSHLLGSVFRAEVLDETRLPDLMKALTNDQAKAAFAQYPVLTRCLEAKCERWATQCEQAWVQELCDRLLENPDQLWQSLSLWALLHGYPGSLLDFVLAPQQALFARKVPVQAVADLPLEPQARGQALAQIELLLADIRDQVKTSDELQKVANWASGRLVKEFEFLYDCLDGKRFSPTQRDVERIQTKFDNCPGVSQHRLESLNYRVKPDRPTLFEQSEEPSWQQWLRWTVDEYAPYRNWQIHNDHYDEDLEKTVARFSEAYIRDYMVLQSDPQHSIAQALADLSSPGSQHDLSIVLLVDCLPVAFFDLLDQALRNVGLNRHELGFRLAALPTATEYNKPALLSGQWGPDATNYQSMLQKRSASDWGGRQSVYLGNLKALAELPTPQESAVVILNLLDGDELLHSDLEAKHTTFDDELSRLYGRVAEAVERMVNEWGGAKEQVKVYVVTDHGACRILEKEQTSFDSKVVNHLFPDETHRFAAVDKQDQHKIPANLWALGHKFEQPFVDDEQVYFLPSGHHTVRQSGRITGYRHGGVTPEEVVVPIAVYKPVEVTWKSPVGRFLDLDLDQETGRAKFYIQRVKTLEIEIQNPNSTDLSVLRASVSAPETDLKDCEVAVIPARSTNIIRLSCYFERSALGEQTLEIELVYEIGGEQHTLPLRLESEFKSAMAGGLNLRDL
jgi:hypothetical protein